MDYSSYDTWVDLVPRTSVWCVLTFEHFFSTFFLHHAALKLIGARKKYIHIFRFRWYLHSKWEGKKYIEYQTLWEVERNRSFQIDFIHKRSSRDYRKRFFNKLKRSKTNVQLFKNQIPFKPQKYHCSLTHRAN